MAVRNLIDEHSYNLKITSSGRADLNDTEGTFFMKGTVDAYTDLPQEGNHDGDVYYVTDAHTKYYWYDNLWRVFADSTAIISNIDEYMSSTSTNPVQNQAITKYIKSCDDETLKSARSYTDEEISENATALRSEMTTADASLQTQVNNISTTIATQIGYTTSTLTDGRTLKLTKSDGTYDTHTITYPGGAKGVKYNPATIQYEHINTCVPITESEGYKLIKVRLDEYGHVTGWIDSAAGIQDADRGLSIKNQKIGHSNTTINYQAVPSFYKIAFDSFGHITDYEQSDPIPEANRGLDVDSTNCIGHSNTLIAPATMGLYKLTIDQYGHITGYSAYTPVSEADRGLSVVSNKIGHSNTVIAPITEYKLNRFVVDQYGHILGSETVVNTDGSLYVNDSTYGLNKIDHVNTINPIATEGLYKIRWNSSGHIIAATEVTYDTLVFTLADGSTRQVKVYTA